MLFEDVDSYKNPIEGKTYISPPIKNSYGDERIVRLVTRAIDQTESYTFAKIKKEIVLRETLGGKNVIRATVYEDPRGISVLSIQEYTPSTGSPHKASFAFIGEEIPKLFKFIKDVMTMQFGSQRYQRLSDVDIEHIEITDSQALQMFLHNQEMFSNIVRSGITTEDIIAVGYRKKQLEAFERLLTDSSFFDELKRKKTAPMKACGKDFSRKTNGYLAMVWDMFF